MIPQLSFLSAGARFERLNFRNDVESNLLDNWTFRNVTSLQLVFEAAILVKGE